MFYLTLKFNLKETVNGKVVACLSGCTRYGNNAYCCGQPPNNLPTTCQSSSYAKFFKQYCPDAYSYAYDDLKSTFTCQNTNYIVQFC